MGKLHKIGRKFIDSVQIYVKGGSGGHGLPKYGGIGGKGGDVYLVAKEFCGLQSFLSLYPHRCITASNGVDSKKFCLIGKPGEDLIIKVPVGITVSDENGTKIGELNEIDEKLIVATGGKGGSKTSVPCFSGVKGQERTIILDLKLIADVGLVGFPNAGKSTLLKAVSRAAPKIAAYPFTTLHPNLGILEYSDLRQISMADLPGLIEGAHENIGMGHKFLKHIERTNILLMVVDIDGFQYRPNQPFRTCIETIVILNKELELYDQTLLDKPIILAINKMDRPESAEKLEDTLYFLKNLKQFVMNRMPEDLRPERIVRFDKIVPISARYDKTSVNKLKEHVRDVLDKDYFKRNKLIPSVVEKKLIKELEVENRIITTI